ncbi:hypothetical protein AAZX31_05G084100 [Glycine max]
MNLFPGLVHTVRHTIGVGHARSHYLKHKEGGGKRKERDGVSLAFGIVSLGGRLARWAISSVVECTPDNCIVVPGL